MRMYQTKQLPELKQVCCNRCGKELQLMNGMPAEGCFHARDRFGYFSERDGILAEFDLCEACYEKVISEFVIPVTETEEAELL